MSFEDICGMGGSWSRWRSSDCVGEAWDFAEVFEVASAVLTGEGFCFGRLRWALGALAEVVAHSLTGFFGGTGIEAVVTNSGKSFG